MALQGSLDTFALGDLIRLLTTTEKTGGLAVVGADVRGQLWFGAGALVGAGERGDADPEAELFDLLRLEDDGDFRFEADVSPDAPSDPLNASELLASAEARVDEWRPVAELVPSPAVGVELRAEVDGDEVTIAADSWRQIVAIGSGTTAGDLAAALDLDEVSAGFVIRDLVEAGLVQVLPTSTEITGADSTVEGERTVDESVAEATALDATPDVAEVAEDPATGEVAEDASAADAADDDELPDLDTAGSVIDPEAELDAWHAAEPVIADAEPAVPSDGTAGHDSTGEQDDLDAADLNGTSSLGPWEPLGAPADAADDELPVEGAVAATAGADESLAVDLDNNLNGSTAEHSYLDGGVAASSLPEPLPVGPEALLDDPGVDVPAEGDDFGALSPAAARAAASASIGDTPDEADHETGGRILRRIISTGNA